MPRLDKGILLAVFTLLGIGLVQVYSSSFIFAIESRGDGLFFFKRQLMFALLAVPALFATAAIPWRWIERCGIVLWVLAILGICLTFVPGIGFRAGGAARWLRLPGGMVFEPSELLKIALPLTFAGFARGHSEKLGRLELPLRALVLLAPLVLVLKQPDFGTFFICISVLLCLLFAFGLRWPYIICGIASAIPAFYFLVMSVPYRRARVTAFMDPWSVSTAEGFQVIQSMLSFRSGGIGGVGLGQGQGKLFFLPEAHTDFTLAVLGEEMGFIGFFVVLSLYAYLVVRGLRLATRTENRFAKALALGLSLTFAFQVFINIGVCMGSLPTKGLTLPFLSYGGSSLLASCLLFGLLLNVERQERKNSSENSFVSRATVGVWARKR